MLKLSLATIACLAVPAFAAAQGTSDGAELAKKLSNPIAALISVPFQYNYNDGYGDGSGEQSYLNIQPVIPISISPTWNVISRTIIPLVDQDDITPGSGSQSGFGNTTQSLFFSPKAPTAGGLIWESGRSCSFPRPRTTSHRANGPRGSGFFSPDIVDAIRPMIVREGGGDLRALLLELLSGSPAVTSLRPELDAIVLDDTATPQCRHAALDCLVGEKLDLAPIIDPLIASGTNESLRLAAKIVTHVGVGRLPREKLRDLLLASANLYPTDPTERERVIGSRYFIRILVRDFDADLCGWLLDEITRGLACTCGARSWECHCRDGISKIAGHLLDRYFDIAEEPRDPGRIWGWLKPLHFHRSVGAKDSPAVRVLHEEHHLRREIQRLMFDGLTTREAMIDEGTDRYGHAGLSFLYEDIRPMMDHAFATGNVELWDFFVYSHNFYRARTERGPDELRQYARQQAQQHPEFLARWAIRQRRQFRSWQQNRDRRFRFQARRRRRERAAESAAVKSLTRDRSIIEAGRHKGWLTHIAQYYLIQPDEMQELTHGLIDVDAALRNYLRTVGDDIPTLEQCALGTARASVVRLHAACVAEFRATCDLTHIDRRILAAVRTDTATPAAPLAHPRRAAGTAPIRSP